MKSSTWYSLISTIKEEIDLCDHIEKVAPLKKRGKYYFCTCPFHDDRRPSMYVHKEKQYWRCPVCNIGGSIIDFEIYLNHHTNIEEAVKALAKEYGYSVSTQKAPKKHKIDYNSLNIVEKHIVDCGGSQMALKSFATHEAKQFKGRGKGKEYAKNAMYMLAGINDNIFNEIIINNISKLVLIDKKELLGSLDEYKQKYPIRWDQKTSSKEIIRQTVGIPTI